MRFWTTLLLALIVTTAAHAADRPADPRVMIVSIDGLRPDLIFRADMPNVRQLMNGGSFSLWAQTVPMAVTMPSHTSMLTGVTVERHGISANNDIDIAQQTLRSKTIFEYAKAAGISSGLAAGKSKFSVLETDADYVWITRQGSTKDAEVADHAIAILRNNKPRLMVVHFPQNDNIGHKIGWGTPEQLEGLADTDVQLGRVLAAMGETGLREQTTVILSADHGGRGRVHGKDDLRSLHIPWIINGPGVRKDFDLTRDKDLTVRTYDTFATACYVLGLPVPPDSDGKAVMLAFEGAELLDPSATQPAVASKPTTRPTGKSVSVRPATRPSLDIRQSKIDTDAR